MDFFTSDLHLGHKLMADSRKHSSIEEMDSAIIETINSMVKEEDRLFILGDISFHNNKKTAELLSLIRCKNLHLIRGNHDNEKMLSKLENYFIWIKDYYHLKIVENEIKYYLIMFHYPMIVWDRSHYGSWHLHGHCHGTLEIGDNSTRMDVGWDVWKRPITLEDIKRSMNSRLYKIYDHHE